MRSKGEFKSTIQQHPHNCGAFLSKNGKAENCQQVAQYLVSEIARRPGNQSGIGGQFQIAEWKSDKTSVPLKTFWFAGAK
jgi:hypothetical protein